MIFLNVMLAGFVVLGAVPIIIHLLNKQRFRVVEWAAIQFLLKSLQKNSRRLQMRDLLLLLLRTLAVVVAALALARPTLTPGHFSLLAGSSAINAVIVLDNSRSMGYRDGTQTRFQDAKVRAKAVLDQLPKGSGAALVLMSDVAQADILQPSQDLTFVADAIEKAPLSDGGTSISAGIAKAWEILKKAEGAREIYLITDGQANAWPAESDTGWKALAAELGARHDLRLYLAEVGHGETANVSLDDLQPVDPLVATDTDTTFTATVVNHGGPALDNLTVQLLADDGHGGELRPVATGAVDHLQGSSQVQLSTRFTSGGRHRIEARLAPDHLEADNHRYLAIDVIDRLKVLIIDGSAEGGYAGGAAFIRAALAPGASQADENAAGSLIDAEVTTPAALADTSLDAYQAVILSNVADLTPGEADGLKTFVAGGKALIVFPGANVGPEIYNHLLLDRAGILPAKLGEHPIEFGDGGGSGSGATSATATKGTTFATSGLSHPIVAYFQSKDTQPFLVQPHFYQAFPLTPVPSEGALGSASAVVARFATGQPAIVERGVGAGTVLLFACGADRQWTDFPLQPAFLIVVRRAVQHAVLSGRVPATVQVHDRLLANLPARDANTRLPVLDPRGGRTSLLVNLASNGRTAHAEVTDTPFAGFWAIGEGPTARRFATNGPAAESDLATIDQRGIERVSGPLQWSFVGAEGDAGAQIARARVGREIWPLLITLAIACLLAESYLAMRWTPRSA